MHHVKVMQGLNAWLNAWLYLGFNNVLVCDWVVLPALITLSIEDEVPSHCPSSLPL